MGIKEDNAVTLDKQMVRGSKPRRPRPDNGDALGGGRARCPQRAVRDC